MPPASLSAVSLTGPAFWVSLSFLAMLMPALACFSKLKRDRRHKYRHSEPTISKA